MITMIHGITGCEMRVHESNVKAYLERGHKLAPETKKEPAKKKPVKRAKK